MLPIFNISLIGRVDALGVNGALVGVGIPTCQLKNIYSVLGLAKNSRGLSSPSVCFSVCLFVYLYLNK